MSRLNPPRSSIAERVRQSSHSAGQSSTHRRSWQRRFNIRFAKLFRWLHIYLSMFGLAAVLFFSVTGITLNHPDWFFGGSERQVQAEGQMDLHWLHVGPAGAGAGDESDQSRQVAKLEVVEHLRQ